MGRPSVTKQLNIPCRIRLAKCEDLRECVPGKTERLEVDQIFKSLASQRPGTTSVWALSASCGLETTMATAMTIPSLPQTLTNQPTAWHHSKEVGPAPQYKATQPPKFCTVCVLELKCQSKRGGSGNCTRFPCTGAETQLSCFQEQCASLDFPFSKLHLSVLEESIGTKKHCISKSQNAGGISTLDQVVPPSSHSI